MMRMKYTKRFYLRMTAIMLALFMMIAGPAQAYAAEENYDQADFTEEIETLSEEEYEDFEGDFIEDEIVEEEPEIADFIEEDSEDLVLEEEAAENEDISVDEPLSEDDLVDIPNEDDADKALRLLRMNGQFDVPRLGDTVIPADAYTVKRTSGFVNIKNNATGTAPADNLYAALVTEDANTQKSIYVLGTEIAPGKSVSLSVAYDANRNRTILDDKAAYVLWIGRADTYKDPDTNEDLYQDFKILGYIPDYDEEGNTVIVDGETLYNRADMVEIAVPAEDSYDDYSGTWKDGYSGIKMKAVLQKNHKSVKISWATDTKNKPEQKNYKKYALYRLIPDASSETGYKEEQVREPKTSKTATVAVNNVLTDSLLFLLKCYDSTGTTLLDEYVTNTAPYLLEMQSGGITGTFDFTMTQRPDDAELYLLEIASQNKEYDEKKAAKGFQSDWSTIYEIEDYFNEGNSIGEYAITKQNKPEAIQLTYNVGVPAVTLGTKYFGRVKTVTYVNGLKVISAPSNVLNCKAGPQKCYVLTTAGVYYDPSNAKKDNNLENIARASEHINAYLNGDEISPKSEIYVHDNNTEVCAKDGLIYFLVDNDNFEDIKSFDLLKCDTQNGKYKKVKNYTLKNAALMECKIGSEYFSGIRVFAIYYNKFVPEKDAFYAVRAVSKTKSTPGGHGSGQYIVPTMDVVQDLITDNADADRIDLAWIADDCVKQYWLYRSEKSINGADRTKVGQNGDQRIAKISISKARKVTYNLSDDVADTKTIKIINYSDKKNVKADTPYFYYVRPVYNTAEAEKDPTKYIELCSNEVMGKASALYAQIKNFKAASDGIERMKVSFNQSKEIKHYRIYRLEVPEGTKKLTDSMKPDVSILYEEARAKYTDPIQIEDYVGQQPESRWREIITSAGTAGYKWQYVTTVDTNGKSTAAKSLTDSGVDVGSYYFYLVQGATDKSSSINFTYTTRVRNVPQPVSSASASYVDNGIRVNWSLKDSSNSHVSVQVKANDRGWVTAGKTSFVDYNAKRGEVNTYQIRVRYHSSSVDVYSSTVTVKYSLPSGIEVTNASDCGELKDNVLTIKKGEYGKIAFRAYLNSGETASYNLITPSGNPEENGIISITDRSANSLSFEAKKVGETSFYLNCAGVSRKITIKVVNKD